MVEFQASKSLLELNLERKSKFERERQRFSRVLAERESYVSTARRSEEEEEERREGRKGFLLMD